MVIDTVCESAFTRNHSLKIVEDYGLGCSVSYVQLAPFLRPNSHMDFIPEFLDMSSFRVRLWNVDSDKFCNQ